MICLLYQDRRTVILLSLHSFQESHHETPSVLRQFQLSLLWRIKSAQCSLKKKKDSGKTVVLVVAQFWDLSESYRQAPKLPIRQILPNIVPMGSS